MTSTENPQSSPELKTEPATSVDDLVDSAEKITLHDEGHAKRDDSDDKKKIAQPSRPLYIYTRKQVLILLKSPLVKPPDGMPALKDWFGSENEQTAKKDPETPNATGTRDRRFRRDAEDADAPPRPSFRSSLSQPSQMGNFKHQSLRASDREREKDIDKERERDIRDKEGQERLRNLSDKYDRDRLALPATLNNLRSKERDSAPHLAPSSSSRLGASNQLPSTTSRRSDARDTGGKKKVGEYSEDWRRGADLPRSARDDRSDISRRDRDERDRPRSRVRDVSRPRRETSVSRRDRDRERDDRDKDRDRERRSERERDEYRRERDDYSRRDKDIDRDMELDDPRRWRDDGKREERLAARRDKDYKDRVRDRAPQDSSWDSQDRYQDRRWTIVEERDGRSKRSSGRDRRSGGILDEGKDREDRRDRDREREKEKEPAWMDTYVPPGSSGGILGGIGAEGELDGIQEWKKGMKEKEQRDNKGTPDDMREATNDQAAGAEKNGIVSSDGPDKELDEIQLFRLMMKREEQKKTTETSTDALSKELQQTGAALQVIENGVPGSSSDKEVRKAFTTATVENPISSDEKDVLQPRVAGPVPLPPSPPSKDTTGSSSDGSLSLLSILASSSKESGSVSVSPNPPAPNPSIDKSKNPGSRFFPKPLSSQAILSVPAPTESAIPDRTSPAPAQFNPPQGSRLLAFGNRTSSTGPSIPSSSLQAPGNHPGNMRPSNGHTSSFQQGSASLSSHPNAIHGAGLSVPPSEIPFNHRPSISETLRAQQGFSPFEDPSRSAFGNDPSRDPTHFANVSEGLRRASVNAERSTLGTSSDAGASYNDLGSIGKGSRFAKFFDGKGREGPSVGANKGSGQVGFPSSSPIPGQRQEQGLNGMFGANTDNRAMDDIFAMLSSSAHGQRTNVGTHLGSAPLSSSSPFGQSHNNMHSMQHPQIHHQQQQQSPPNGRVDSLYESRQEDRQFVPDGMVPGLRSAPPPRTREHGGVFADTLEDPMQFNSQRLPHQQRGGLDQMYSGPVPSMYSQQAGLGRNGGIPITQYRGGPSPITGQNPHQGLGQQRLPPGLANLGGRPPHEPSQFMGTPMGMASGGLHGPMHSTGPSPQQFNNFGPGSGLGFGGGPQMRGVPPAGPHQLQNPLAHGSMGGLGHPGNIDMRGPNQAQLLAMGGGVGVGGGMRGAGGGFGGPQQAPNAQMQPPLVNIRQQQQQQAPPHLMQHMLPPHLQQQNLPGGNNNQPAHDLMALLMGGPHRE